ncbi:MAG: hypothetical protein ACP5I3_12160, partial [Thermoproteus sp.]
LNSMRWSVLAIAVVPVAAAIIAVLFLGGGGRAPNAATTTATQTALPAKPAPPQCNAWFSVTQCSEKSCNVQAIVNSSAGGEIYVDGMPAQQLSSGIYAYYLSVPYNGSVYIEPCNITWRTPPLTYSISASLKGWNVDTNTYDVELTI